MEQMCLVFIPCLLGVVSHNNLEFVELLQIAKLDSDRHVNIWDEFKL
jgi:hypothetical protein